MFIDTRVVTATLLITIKRTTIFSPELRTYGCYNLTGKWLNSTKDSAVLGHILQCICTIDFDHFDILATGVNQLNLLVKESLLIKPDSPVLNRTICTKNEVFH